MKNVLAEILQRTFLGLDDGNKSCLRIAERTSVEEIQVLKAPLGTVLLVGVDNSLVSPVALFAATTPYLSTDHPGLLALVVRRAQAHKAPYFITWTLRDAILWKTPKPGTPAVSSQLEKIRHYEVNYAISQDAETRIFDEQLKLGIITVGHKIISDIESLFKDQALELVRIDATYFVERLVESVHTLLPLVSDSLHMRFEGDLDFRSKFNQWAIDQGIAGDYKDKEYAVTISRQIIYRLLGKILFYQSLRRIARHLPPLQLNGVDEGQVLPTLRQAFSEALKVDYHAVFSEVDPPDTIAWPGQAATQLAALIHDFNTRDFSSLPQDVIGTVFERLIPPEDRHLLGQYFTSEQLCDLGIAFSVRTPHDLVADLTCGTATFLIRSYDRKRWLGNHDHSSLLSELWGIEIAPFPAELAVINLFRQNLTAEGNFPRITCRDIFTIKPGDSLPFPPQKMDILHPNQINEPVPYFDAIIGNFPYVSGDQIEQKQSGYTEFLRKTLIDGWLEKYPQLFYYKSPRQQEQFERSIAAGNHKSSKQEELEHRLSTYADLYVYLFFHASRFIKISGRMSMITSNAWLDVNYGYALQQFLCDHFKIVAILESRCEPWFTEASVNTVYTILERCENSEERNQHLVKFVKVKKKLSDLMPMDPEVQATERWKQIRRLTDYIESAGHKDVKTVPFGILTEENEDFRIRICRQGELKKDIESEKKTIKWGKYLRAPDVFLEIIKIGHFCLLRDLAIPKFGSKTRINEFFHVSKETAKQFSIEHQYLKPLIKSPKDSSLIPITSDEIGLKIFICRRSKKELRQLGHLGALRYIEWGEKQTYSRGEFNGLPWPVGTWVIKRKPGWYALPQTETNAASVFFTQALGEKHMHRYSTSELIPDARLYYLKPKNRLSDTTIAAILNSSICALSCELAGRVTMGDGVLELKVEDARDYLLVPDIRKISSTDRQAIAKSFAKICKRDIKSVFDEVKQKDRQDLDIAILNAIGLDPKKYLKPIYDALCELVRERSALSEMRGKIRRTKVRKTNAEKEIFQEVLDEILPDGPKKFPDDFFSADASTGVKKDLVLPEALLRLDISPMYVILYLEKKVFLELRNPGEGKFIVYCQRAGQQIAHIPEKIVEITRTVANYEKYLKELRVKLYESYYRRSLDVAVAERLTQAVFDRFKLPPILGGQ